MTLVMRKHYAKRFRDLLDNGEPRKAAILAVRREAEAMGHRMSKSSLYSYCKQAKVDTK